MPMNDLQNRRLEEGREYRNLTMTVRAAEGAADMIVEGYATTFNQPYELYRYGGFIMQEQVDPNAFNDCDMTDVIFQYDHRGRVFARTRNNTLSLRTDAHGLYITADLGGTEEGRKLYEDIKGGYIDRMSFGFVVAEDSRIYIDNKETGEETCLRTILKISKLYDVSAVSIPANDMTAISARRLADGAIEGRAEERRQTERKKLRLKLMIGGI